MVSTLVSKVISQSRILIHESTLGKRHQHDMDTKNHRVNLSQKRKAQDGQWQFYPVQRAGNKPDPRLIILHGEPASWKGEGAYFLDWREGGKRTRRQVGKSPREALDAWRKATGVATGSIPADVSETDGAMDTPGISIEAGIKQCLDAVEATKGARNTRFLQNVPDLG
jgi:hypothetical protein